MPKKQTNRKMARQQKEIINREEEVPHPQLLTRAQQKERVQELMRRVGAAERSVQQFEAFVGARSRNRSGPVAGFDRGLFPERVLDCCKIEEKVYYEIKWAGTNLTEFVPSFEARIRVPQLVIEYFQSIIMWKRPQPPPEQH